MPSIQFSRFQRKGLHLFTIYHVILGRLLTQDQERTLQIFFHVSSPHVIATQMTFRLTPLGPRKLRLVHAEYVVGVHPAALFSGRERQGRRTGPRSPPSPHRVRRERDKAQGAMLNTVPRSREYCAPVAVHLAAGVAPPGGRRWSWPRQRPGNLHEQVTMVKRVHVPQIEHGHL